MSLNLANPHPVKSVYRILLVEDNPGDAAMIMARLEDAPERLFVVIHVTKLDAALATLAHGALEAIILDMNLPDSQGAETLTAIKTAAASIPIIVVSGMIQEDLRAMVISLGAEDVFNKSDASSRLFSRSILHVIERNRSREQHRQFERLLESTPDAVLVVARTTGLIRYVNRSALLLFGRSREDLLGERLGFSVSDREPTEVRILRRGDERICEMRVVTVEWHGEQAYLGSIRDLTELKESRREAEARAAVLRSLLDGISGLASRLGFVELGNASDPVLHAHPRETVPEEVLASILVPFESAFRGYADANQRLSSQNRELADAKAATEVANRELEAFSYSVAHDLRAPLRSVQGFAQALLEDCGEQLDELGRQHLWRIRDSAERMGWIIEALLKLSRITRSALRRTTIDLSGLVRGVFARIKQANPGRDVTLTVPEGLVVEADRHLLEVALENLLGNAFKFTAKRHAGKIEFGSQDGEHGRSYYVRDNGVGFDGSQQQRLFGVFQRLHSPEEFEGTGIGLSIVRRIVERHGGRVWAEGARGQGATFHFSMGSQVSP